MDLTGEIKEYAEREHEEKITEILSTQGSRRHNTIAVDTLSLFADNVMFAHVLFERSSEALRMLNEGFQNAAQSIWKKRKMTAKVPFKNIHARLTALPNLPEIYRRIFPNCSDVGQFMCLCGTVIRTTAPKVLEYKKLWKCTKCKYSFTIEAEVDQYYVSEKPTACPNPEWCNNKSFTLLSRDIDPLYCKDYQEMKIQEQAYNLSIGSIPRSMWIILEDDLVDNCQAGNDVIVSGVLIQRWKPLVKGKFIDIELVLLAHNVEVNNKLMPDVVSENLVNEFGQFWLENKYDPLKGRDLILSSICPQIFGLYIVKLAVALVLAGGVEKKDENSRIRGDSHLLLVGDPGTGKSQFLKFASKVSMRSVLTSGIGTTNAGLTVSAVKESGRWQLEAGALVLADGGICCIDEFSCIKEQDKTCIHEAMEQQTISVAKAGLVCRLSTRCSILAATNPKGKYDSQLSLSENTALGSPLLSRFDIILVLLDTYDEKWDDMVASYILEGFNLSEKKKSTSAWPISKMRNYFSLIRYIKPKVTPACEKVLQTYYTRQRNLAERNYARTTPRLLQSLIRLAEGHARLMFRYEVLVVDAVVAIMLVESSMSESSILSGVGALHTSFPDDPKSEYQERAKTILSLLKLDNLLKETENYTEGLNIRKLLSDISGARSFQNISADSSHLSNNILSGCQEEEKENCFTPQAGTSSDDTEPISLENPINIMELIASFNEEAPISSDNEVLRDRFVNLENGKDKMVIDEVSTLADLNTIFHENFISSDATSEGFGNLFTKKKNSSQSASNDLELDQCDENADFKQNLKNTKKIAGNSQKKILQQETPVFKADDFNEMMHQIDNKISYSNKSNVRAVDISKPSTSGAKQIIQEQNKISFDDANIQINKNYDQTTAQSAKREYFEQVDNNLPNFFKRKYSINTVNISPSSHQQGSLVKEVQRNKRAKSKSRDLEHQKEITLNSNLEHPENLSSNEIIQCTSTNLAYSEHNSNSSQPSQFDNDLSSSLNYSTPLSKDNNYIGEKKNSVNDEIQSRIKSKLSKFAKPVFSKDNSNKMCQPGSSMPELEDSVNVAKAALSNVMQQAPNSSSISLLQKQCIKNMKGTVMETIASKGPQLSNSSKRPVTSSQFSQATFKRVFSNAVDLSDFNNDDLDIEHLFDM